MNKNEKSLIGQKVNSLNTVEKEQRKKHLLKLFVPVLLIILVGCPNPEKKINESIDTQTYFLSFIDKLPDSNILTSDSLTAEQNETIKKYNLGVYVPKNFKSVVDINDKEAFIFYNSQDSSVLLAKCFPMTDSTFKQIEKSTKFNSPIYGPDYNDLSEFKHFKKCENIITDFLIGPFFFGGTLFVLLGADYVMHQEFLPKSKKYEFGEFTILFDEKKYLFICSLHNGYSEDINDKARWQAFRFKND